VVWIFGFTACLGISLGVNFFVWPNFDFWAQGRGSKLVPEPKKSKMVKNGRKNLNKSPKILKNINFIKIGKKYFWGLFGPFLAPFGPFWGRKSRNSQKNLKKSPKIITN